MPKLSDYCVDHCPHKPAFLGKDQPCFPDDHCPSSQCKRCKEIKASEARVEESLREEILRGIYRRRHDEGFMREIQGIIDREQEHQR